MPMNPELKAKWIEALRSGKYKQGKGKLVSFHPDSATHLHCCLGVLCDIEKLLMVVDLSEGRLSYKYKGESNWSLLPLNFGLDINLPHHIQNTLAEMNDSGASFVEIARYLEENEHI